MSVGSPKRCRARRAEMPRLTTEGYAFATSPARVRFGVPPITVSIDPAHCVTGRGGSTGTISSGRCGGVLLDEYARRNPLRNQQGAISRPSPRLEICSLASARISS